MTDERWSRVKALFQAAVERPIEERDAFLAAATGDDAALRDDVESLLTSDTSDVSFLDRLPATADSNPADAPRRGDAALLDEVESLVRSSLQAGSFLESGPLVDGRALRDNLEGCRIGPYEMGPRIGAGGMADVYRATDTRLNRTVAIKVRAGRFADEQFTREAKAISALNHPRICLLYDVGQCDAIDYLVIEYVEGEPIDVYCDRRRLGLRPRLEMFRAVCEAVHYAHQHLVVHRDLKPGNILVGADGQPKLLDFGIATLLAGGDTDDAGGATLVRAMTPDYASPEQVRGETVTTATDVYSLGVILYELLAGRRPFAVRTTSLEDIVHDVCETDPAPPSTALREASDEGVTFRMPKEIRGDLDTIVLKALRKEAEHRYLSVQELAADISRCLGGKPVAARGDALKYRLSKFLRRHRAAVLAAMLLCASLIGGLVLIIGQYQVAEAQRQRAERRFADVRKLAGSLLFEFHDGIKYLPGSTRARELLVKRALEYLDGLAAEAGDDSTLRAEVARAYRRVADVQGNPHEANLGDAVGAIASYQKARTLQEALVATRPFDQMLQLDLARILNGLGDVQLMMRDHQSALASYRRALSIGAGLEKTTPGNRDVVRTVAASEFRIGDALAQLGERIQAAERLERALAIYQAFATDGPDLESQRELVRAYKRLGTVRAALGDLKGNLALVQEALRLSESLAVAHPLDTSLRHEVAMSSLELGLAHLRADHLPDALRYFTQAATLTGETAAGDPSNAQARWMQGVELNLVAQVLRRTHRQHEALEVHRKALALLESLARADSANESYTFNVADTCQLIAESYVSLAGDVRPAAAKRDAWSHARSWYRRSAAMFEGMRHRGTLTGEIVAVADRVAAGLTLCDRELRQLASANASRP